MTYLVSLLFFYTAVKLFARLLDSAGVGWRVSRHAHARGASMAQLGRGSGTGQGSRFR